MDVSIHFDGEEPIHTTAEGIRRATAALELEAATKGRGRRMGSATETMMPGDDAMAAVRDANKKLAAGAKRRAAARSPQTDLEEFTGNEAQEEREAEVGGIAADRLSSIVERIEKTNEEIKELGEHRTSLFAEAKSAGFDVKVLRAVITLRQKDPDDVKHAESLLELYMRALGMG